MDLLRAAGEGQKEESDSSQFGGIFSYQTWVNQGGCVAEMFKFTLLLLSVLFNLLPFPIPI